MKFSDYKDALMEAEGTSRASIISESLNCCKKDCEEDLGDAVKAIASVPGQVAQAFKEEAEECKDGDCCPECGKNPCVCESDKACPECDDEEIISEDCIVEDKGCAACDFVKDGAEYVGFEAKDVLGEDIDEEEIKRESLADRLKASLAKHKVKTDESMSIEDAFKTIGSLDSDEKFNSLSAEELKELIDSLDGFDGTKVLPNLVGINLTIWAQGMHKALQELLDKKVAELKEE